MVSPRVQNCLGCVDIYEPCNGLSGLSRKSNPDVPQFKEGITISALAKHHRLKPSRTARKAVSQPTSILQPTLQAGVYRSVTKAICAVQASRRLRAAFFAYFFLLLKKSRSPKASEAIHEALGPNAFNEQATHLLLCA